MRIKKLTLKNIPELYLIICKALDDDFPEYKPGTNRIYSQHIFNKKYFTKLIKNKTNVVFGAFDKEKLAGIIVVKPEDFGGVIYVDWLVVDKNYRNKGVGSRLLTTVDNWALENKYHHLYLLTQNRKNINFYIKRGYKYLGTHENGWFGETDHIMQKNLRPKPFPEIFDKYLVKS